MHWFYDNICGVFWDLRSHKNAVYLLVRYLFASSSSLISRQTVFYLKVLFQRPAAVTDYVDADLGQNLQSSDSVIGNKEAVRLDITTTTTHLPS